MKTIKVKVRDISQAPEVEHEIPTTCPGCGADLEHDSPTPLREEGYIGTTWYGRISGVGVDTGEDYKDCAEDSIVTGYTCNACDHVLA